MAEDARRPVTLQQLLEIERAVAAGESVLLRAARVSSSSTTTTSSVSTIGIGSGAAGAACACAAFVFVMQVHGPGEGRGPTVFPWSRAMVMDMVATSRLGQLKQGLLLPEVRNNMDYTRDWAGQGVVAGAVLEVKGGEAIVSQFRNGGLMVRMGLGIAVVDPARVLCRVYTRLSGAVRAKPGTFMATMGGLLAAYEYKEERKEHCFVLTNRTIASTPVVVTKTKTTSGDDDHAHDGWAGLVGKAVVMTGVIGVNGNGALLAISNKGFAVRLATTGFRETQVWWDQGGVEVTTAKAAARRALATGDAEGRSRRRVESRADSEEEAEEEVPW